MASPTLIDGPPSPTPAPRRSGRRAGLVVSILVTLTLLAGLGGFAFYWTVIRYEPVAHRHIPEGSSLAARFDFQEIALFGPVRRHLWPLLLDEGWNHDEGGEPSWPKRIEARTGLNLARDIREMVVVSHGPTVSGRWLVILGGKIPAGLMPKLAQVVSEESRLGWAFSKEDEVLSSALGIAIGQAKDRALIIASDRSTLSAALPSQSGGETMGLPEAGAFTFAVAPSAWREWGSGIAANLLPGMRTLSKIQGCNGRFSLGSSPELQMQCRLASDIDPNHARSSLMTLVNTVRGMSALAGGPDLLGERQALSRLEIEAYPDGRLRMTAPWPLEALERGTKTLAEKIRGVALLTGMR